MITRLSHTTVYVLDCAKAHDVYVQMLGCTVTADFRLPNGFRWLSVTPGGSSGIEIVLYEISALMLGEANAALFRQLAEQHGLGGGVFETDDCQAAYESMLSKGIQFLQPPTRQFYGIEALFRDGCGNWFSLTQRVSPGR